MKKIGVGVIGVGFIGPVHIEAVRRLGFAEVVAISDNNQAVADAKASEYHIPKAYGDYIELINDPNVECVHITTPNYLHFPMAKAAIAAGKHVLCDKPLAMTSVESAELVRLAKEAGVVAAINFNLRFYPLAHQVKAMIDNGELGEIFAINGSYQQDWLQKETDYSWRLEPDQSGDSRAIADIGSHWLDLIEFMTGRTVSRVCADFATFFPTRKKPLKPVETYSGKILTAEDYQDVPIETEDYATVLLHFENGAHGSVTVNQVAAGRKNRLFFEIYGSKKSVCFDSEKPNELWIGERDTYNGSLIRDPSLLVPVARDIVSYPGGHNEGFADTFKQCFNKLYTYIKDEGHKKGLPATFPTFEDGHRELLLCEAIVDSAKAERWLEVK